MGITGRTYSDILIMYLPVMVSFLLIPFMADFSSIELILAIFAFYIADAGHVYTTILRCRFQEKGSWKKIVYPFTIFSVLFFGAFSFHLNIVWSLVVYATFVHNIKQAYGVSVWYSTMEERPKTTHLKKLFYCVNLLAFLQFHFRADFTLGPHYPTPFIYFFDSPITLLSLRIIYGVALSLFIFERFKNTEKGHAFFYPLLITGTYFYCFFLAGRAEELLIPLVLTHGFAYLGIIDRSHKALFNKNGLLPLVILVIIGGFLDFFILEEMIFYKVNIFLHHGSRSLVLGALFTHYYLDGILWKRDNSDALIIYQNNERKPNELY